jgi:hypothetical protein
MMHVQKTIKFYKTCLSYKNKHLLYENVQVT